MRFTILRHSKFHFHFISIALRFVSFLEECLLVVVYLRHRRLKSEPGSLIRRNIVKRFGPWLLLNINSISINEIVASVKNFLCSIIFCLELDLSLQQNQSLPMNELIRELNNSTITLTFDNAQNNGSLSRSNSGETDSFSLSLFLSSSSQCLSSDEHCCTE